MTRLLSGFALVWRDAAGQALRGKRGLALAVLAALPIGMTALQINFDERLDAGNYTGTILMALFQFVVPFAGLFLGVAVLGDEIEGRTITYLFTRPLPRPVFYAGRVLGYAAAGGLLVAASALVIGQLFVEPLRLRTAEVWGTAGIAVAGLAVYLAFFAVLRVLLEKALYVGFFLAFILEGFVSKMPNSGLSGCSVWHYLALLEVRLLRSGTTGVDDLTQGIGPTETSASALTFLAVFFAVTLVAGGWLVKAREVRVPAAVA